MPTLAVRNQNPGNLKDPTTGNFQSFSDPAEGKAALYNDLTAKMTGTSTTGLNGNSSLLDFAKTYAPASDKNDPVQYAANLANKLGVSPDEKIGSLTSRIDDFASAVSSNEDPSVTYKATNQQNSYNPKPFSNSAPGQFDFTGSPSTTSPSTNGAQGIGTDLSNRITEGSNALTDIPAALSGKGKQNVFSDVLQAGGAVGGAVGDVTNRLIEATPIVNTAVKGIEGLIGQGVGALAKTSVGQSVIKSVSDWSAKNPELAKDVGAGFNIITAIPILKGLGAIKNVAMDSVAQALKGVAEKGATKDLTATVARTVGGRKALASNPDIVKTLVDERALPDIEGGKYTTKAASEKLNAQISHIDETELQAALDKANVPETSSRVPLDKYKQEAVANAKDELMNPKGVEDMFDLIKAKYGDYPTLSQMNEAKRIVARRISEAAFGSPEASSNKLVRSALQKSVEEGAAALNLGDVNAINQKMARLIKAEGSLKYIEGKPVRVGMLSGAFQDAAMAGGEMAGNATGIPLAGAYLGREGGGFIGKKFSNFRKGILNRTSKDYVQTPLKTSAKRIVQGVLSARAQNPTKSP